MQESDRFLRLLDELGELAGDDLAPSEHRVTTLSFEGVEISLESQNNSDFIYFHAPIKPLGTDPAGLAAAMKQNMFQLPLTGSWLALDGETDELVLCFSAPLETATSESLVATIGAISSVVRDLRYAQQPSSASEETEGGPTELSDEPFNLWMTKA